MCQQLYIINFSLVYFNCDHIVLERLIPTLALLHLDCCDDIVFLSTGNVDKFMKCDYCEDKKVIYGFGGIKKPCACTYPAESSVSASSIKIKRKPGPKPKQEVSHAAC